MSDRNLVDELRDLCPLDHVQPHPPCTTCEAADRIEELEGRVEDMGGAYSIAAERSFDHAKRIAALEEALRIGEWVMDIAVNLITDEANGRDQALRDGLDAYRKVRGEDQPPYLTLGGIRAILARPSANTAFRGQPTEGGAK